MKSLFFTLLMAIVTTVACSQTKDPLTIQNEKYEFGKITYGKPVEYIVTLTNTGTDSLTLKNVKAGCGCTTPSFVPNQVFGPGQSIQITIRFDGSVLGRFVRYTDIFLSGGITKQVSFTGEGVQETKNNKSK
ncbi:MAG: DUF1573 domain-containing protein [Sediminibacterium sp.]|jgi:hypothetical protein|nr:DUF1573 domain-containing protein [Sediminibacterium sp.]MBX9779274.1 DUF1573 domain-containing protein [Chitinophagaceae bacterium]